ncbi:MBL fold metallo-hydrolase [Alcanivorax sp.]|uniref:MBL fold metallo-hydrolase n=1 Tax=Alcanivorax sp. TaxID=1872427 RepID=UPI003BAA1DE8
MGDRKLVFIDTPGHARHHFCVYDPASRGIFTGDTFGLSYPPPDHRQRPLYLPDHHPGAIRSAGPENLHPHLVGPETRANLSHPLRHGGKPAAPGRAAADHGG